MLFKKKHPFFGGLALDISGLGRYKPADMAEKAKVKGLSIIIPACNEEKGLPGVVDEIKRVMERSGLFFEIIVVDDGSTDKTFDAARNAGFTAVRHDENRGYGAAIKTGVKKAAYEHVAIIDADGTYPAEALPELAALCADADMAVGSRTGASVNIPAIRRPAKRFLNAFANYLTSKRIPDLNSGLRVFRKSAVGRFLRLLPDGFSFTSTITIAMLTNGMEVNYLSINYRPRKGKSKIRPVRDTIGFFQLVGRTAMYFAPLKVFLPISAFLLFAGLAILALSALFLEKILDATVTIIVMTAVQVAVIGLLADLIDKRQ